MHLPATPEAVGFLKEHHFRQMKKSAIFINTGRGPTVVELALIKALQEAASPAPGSMSSRWSR